MVFRCTRRGDKEMVMEVIFDIFIDNDSYTMYN